MNWVRYVEYTSLYTLSPNFLNIPKVRNRGPTLKRKIITIIIIHHKIIYLQGLSELCYFGSVPAGKHINNLEKEHAGLSGETSKDSCAQGGNYMKKTTKPRDRVLVWVSNYELAMALLSNNHELFKSFSDTWDNKLEWLFVDTPKIKADIKKYHKNQLMVNSQRHHYFLIGIDEEFERLSKENGEG